MNNKLIIFLVLIGFAFAYTTYEAMKLNDKLGGPVSRIVIKEMPKDLTFEKFETGEPLNMQDRPGKVFVHFWATWCGPCEVEFPELVEFVNLMREKKDIIFYFVAVNDDVKKVKKFLSKYSFENENIVLVQDNDSNYQKFGSYKLPETFLFGSDYQTLRKFEGQTPWMQKTIVNYFNSL